MVPKMEPPELRVRCIFERILMGARSFSTSKTLLLGWMLATSLEGASLACKMSAIKSARGGCVPIGESAIGGDEASEKETGVPFCIPRRTRRREIAV